jgi:GAG-pre-integrase domain
MYYCATIQYRVLYPQCLDTQWRANKLGTVSESTSSTGTVLQWTNRKGSQFTKTIIHSEQSSVPMFLTKPTKKKFRRFHQTGRNDHDECSLAVAMPAHYFSGDEPMEVNRPSLEPTSAEPPTDGTITTPELTLIPPNEEATTQESEAKLREIPLQIDFHDTEYPDENVEQEGMKDEFQDLSPKTLKLLWHYRLGHLPFSTINRMAKNVYLPKKLANCPDPMCTVCIYRRMTKRP